MFKKLTNKDVLKEILSQKTSYFDKFLTVKYKKMSDSKPKIFLIVPSAVSKKAVIRNKIKRRSRAVLKGASLLPLVSLAVFFKKGSAELTFKDLKEKLSTAVKNIKQI